MTTDLDEASVTGLRLRVLWFVCLCLCVSTTPRGWAQRNDSRAWYTAYDDGLDQLKQGKLTDAEQSFQVAIHKGPSADPKNRTQRVFRYGARPGEPFYPEYYLALVYLKEGKPKAAADTFRTVQKDGLVAKDAQEFKDLVANLNRADYATANAYLNDGKRAEAADLYRRIDPDVARANPAEFKDLAANRGKAEATPSIGGGPPPIDKVATDRDRSNQLLGQGQGALNAEQFDAARQYASLARAVGVDTAGADGLLRNIDVAEAIKRSSVAIASGNWTEAERFANTLRSRDPSNAQLALLIGKIAQGRAAAVANVRSATSTQKWSEADRLIGLLKTGDPTNADLPALTTEITAGRAAAINGIRAAVALQHWSDADRLLVAFRRDDPGNAELPRLTTSIRQGRAAAVSAISEAIRIGNLSDAGRLTGALKASDPDNPDLPALTALISRGLTSLDASALERTAVRAFYSGEYQQTLDLMGKLLERPDGGTARAYFYSACSHAALGLLAGQNGAEHLKTARALFAKTQPFVSRLTEDRKFVSPGILHTLEQNKLP